MNSIPRYVYNPRRTPPEQPSLELMNQLKQLYLHPIQTQPKEVRPVNFAVAAGLDEVRSFRGRRI